MSKLTLTLASLAVGGSLLAGLLSIQPAHAQFNGSGDSRDPFARAAAGDTSGLMGILQGLQNGRQRDPNEVAREQGEQIDSAANDFRAEQLRRLREQGNKKK
jgi:hypothetical protein